MDEYSTEVGRLQEKLRDQRARLAVLDGGSHEHQEQVGEVLIATQAMLDHEFALPVLRDIARLRVSKRIVYTTAGVETAVLAGLGVLSAVDQVSRWYLVPVLTALTFTITLLGTEPSAGRGGHGTRVASTIFTLLAVAMLALVMLRVISAYWLWVDLAPALLALICRAAAAGQKPVAGGSGP